MPNPITWDAPEDRKFEYGVSNTVLYTKDNSGAYSNAEAWNGMINITDSPSGADNQKLHADNIEYAAFRALEKYGCSLEAYTYPDSFAKCDGSAEPIPGMYMRQQKREPFGLSWRTEKGNANDSEAGYKIHVAYGMTASPAERGSDTVNESTDVTTFSWDAEATPVPVTGYKPTAKLEFDSDVLSAAKMTKLKEILYGTASVAASLPLPDDIITALNAVT